MLAPLLLLTVGCTVVQVEELGEIAPEQVAELARGLAQSLEARSGEAVRVEDRLWWGCGDSPAERCAGEARARAGCTAAVLLRVFGGVASTRLEARLVGDGAGQPVARNLPRQREHIRPELDAMAAALVPEPAAPPALAAPSAPPVTARWELGPLPWLCLGAAVAVLAAGTALELSSAAARESVESQVLSGARADQLQGRAQDRGAAARALWIGGALLGAGGVVLLAY